jgi:hypothetical protein
MFTIREGSCADKMMIKNISGTVNEDNTVTVTWDWPEDGNLNLCVIYAIEDDEPLEELLRRDAPRTVLQDEFGVRHTTEIQNLSVRIKIFPAIRVSSNEIQIVNQVKGNISEVFYKRIKLNCKVEYKTSMFAQTKKAFLSIHGLNEMGDDYIMYRCIGGGKDRFLYPIDLNKFRNQGVFKIHLDKKEEVRVILTKKQEAYIKIIYS